MHLKENEQQQAICRSVFKNGKNTTSKSQFTGKWIELVNRLEKNKEETGT